MSGILHAQQSSSCCCRAVVAPCNLWDARREMLREDENGVPFFGEFRVQFVGSLTTTITHVCDGWVNCTATQSISLPDVILRNATSQFTFVGAVQVSPPTNAGTWSASYGVRLEDWSGFNCCRCAKGIPQPPPCPQNCDPPPFCPANLGLIAREHGNPLAPQCWPTDSILHPFCQACTLPGGFEWFYHEYFRTNILGPLNLKVANASVQASGWPQGILCGSQQSIGVTWNLQAGAFVGAPLLCPNGQPPLTQGGPSGSLFQWSKPCCNPADGPVGVYLPSPSMPQSGTYTSQDGCSVYVVTSTFPQGYARVSRIPE